MKNISKKLKDLQDKILYNADHDTRFLRNKLFEALIDGQFQGSVTNDFEEENDYSIDIDDRDIRLFILDILWWLKEISSNHDDVYSDLRELIEKTKKQGKK